MSQSDDRDDETAAALPVTLEFYLDGTPANDVTPSGPIAPQGLRRGAGPLGLARAYWVLWGGMLLNRLGGTVFFLLGIYLTRDRRMSPELAGLVISLYAAGGLLAGPVGGALADRAGRRTTLLAGTTIAGTLMLALGLARSTAVIVALAPCLGFFTDLCRPPLQAAVADIVPPAERARAYGLLHWAINLGFAGAASFGGALADRHFTLLFVIDAGTTLGYGALVFFGLPETGRAGAGVGARASVQSDFTAPFRDWRFVRFTLIQLLLLLAFAQVVMTLPLDMHAHGLSTARIGWLLGLNGALIVILQPIALRALRGFGLPHWLAAGAALVGVGLGTTALAGGGPTPVYALAVVLWTLGEIGFATAAPTLVAQMAPSDRRGTYQGTYQLAWGIASTAAPALGSLVLVRLGPVALWLGCLGVCLAAAGLHLRFTGRGR
jgi:MFS family permease